MGAKNNQPTEKQATAMELIRGGKGKRAAMIQAGYAKSTSQAPGQNLLRSVGAGNIIEQQKEAYTIVGITPHYMARKSKEWLEAKKIQTSHTEPDKKVADYPTQLEAAKMVRTDWGLGQQVTIAQQFNIELPSWAK